MTSLQCIVILLNVHSRVKQPLDQILGRSVDELKTTSPQGSASPGTPSIPVDRAAAKRAELRRMEQERRRREAVSTHFELLDSILIFRRVNQTNTCDMQFRFSHPTDARSNRHEHAKRSHGRLRGIFGKREEINFAIYVVIVIEATRFAVDATMARQVHIYHIIRFDSTSNQRTRI